MDKLNASNAKESDAVVTAMTQDFDSLGLEQLEQEPHILPPSPAYSTTADCGIPTGPCSSPMWMTEDLDDMGSGFIHAQYARSLPHTPFHQPFPWGYDLPVYQEDDMRPLGSSYKSLYGRRLYRPHSDEVYGGVRKEQRFKDKTPKRNLERAFGTQDKGEGGQAFPPGYRNEGTMDKGEKRVALAFPYWYWDGEKYAEVSGGLGIYAEKRKEKAIPKLEDTPPFCHWYREMHESAEDGEENMEMDDAQVVGWVMVGPSELPVRGLEKSDPPSTPQRSV